MEDALTCSNLDEQSSFLVRQPIFNRDKSVWGYELVTESAPTLADGGLAICLTDMVEAFKEILAVSYGELAHGQKIILNVEYENFCDRPAVSTWENCVFSLSSKATKSLECSLAADNIHGQGGLISLEGNASLADCGGLLEKSEFVHVSLANMTPPQIVQFRRKFKDYKGKLIVKDVKTWQDFEGTRALGFDYFQGPFFSLPEIKEDKELSVGTVAKMQLLKELGNPECQVDELANIIASDVSLSYRILKYINSATFGLRNKISSIQQAVSLLGLKEVRHWAMVVAMTGMDTSDKGGELGMMALQRGRFLHQIAETTKGFPHPPSSMFLLGLFSKLDAMLSHSMERALDGMPLDADIHDALCGVLNDYRDWLMLLDAIEIGNWDIARSIMAKYGVNVCDSATLYMKASSWAAELMPEMR